MYEFVCGLAGLSTCKRRAVGCALLPEDMSRVAGIGYNGPAAGEDNGGCRAEEGACGCLHAEANALIKSQGGKELIMLTTVSPCEHCAGLLINHGGVFACLYGREYRDPAGVRRLRAARVEAYPVGPFLPEEVATRLAARGFA